MFRKLIIHTKRTVKIITITAIAIFFILSAVALLYKPTYSVTINGEHVGYTNNKSQLQKNINDYVKNGEGENVAFVQVNNLPEYKLCLLKKGIVTNDEEIIAKVKEQGTPYYRYYAILDNEEEKAYVVSFKDAEDIVNSLKDKKSSNIEKISIVEKYETQLQSFISAEEAVSKLYVEPAKSVTVAKTKSSSGSVNTATTTSGKKVGIGISLIRPVSGTLTSRFGERSSIRSSAHTGLDIATSSGTPFVAAAAGTVTFAGWKGSYGNMIVVSHGNGVQTYYAHCSKIYVSNGTQVSQGQKIGAVGSTGNSTGPHLHLEVRVNGVAYNPQNYVY